MFHPLTLGDIPQSHLTLGDIPQSHQRAKVERYENYQYFILRTVVATVFIPITFITGLYGMNFDYMPELHWKHGCFAVLLVMLLTWLGSLVWFRRRGWG